MATRITLTSGSILNGNPITLAVTPNNIANASMHRIILEVECGMSGGDYEVIKLSSPVITEGRAQTIDISSALRTFRDSYEYTPDPTTYPIVKFNVKAYDEYMLNGEIHPSVSPVWFPQNPADLPADRRDEAYLRTIFGAFTDIERITAGPTQGVTTLSRKPSIPQIVKVGETFAYTPPYSTEQKLEQSSALTAPQSKIVTVSKEGAQTLGYQSVYALPASTPQERGVFRFINRFGVLESVSVVRQYEEQASHIVNEYVVSRQETFNGFSRGIVRKQDGPETWKFATGPLDEAWLRWYIYEFLMSEHIWLQVADNWLLVHIIPEETTKIKNSTDANILELQFSVRFDINGSPIL